ncbi:MAG: replication initiator protein A [Methylobacterium sp.]|uniref:replication initiator protein A n=1 Tax=Methylobacterium sp. TaxID=409 RepID=UPI0025E60703|nr:replication initiator protein A [Methylobacterium sp.]MBX9932840.1 replication initiator protein A [Methylobacterium sp.]
MAAEDKRPLPLGDLLGDLDPDLAKALDGLGKGVLRNAEVHSKPLASSGDALARNGAGKQAPEGEQGRAPTTGLQKKTVTRALPPGDEQQDMFTPWVRDIASKDSRSIMDVAVFRLSKRDKRANEVIRYDMPDGYVEVSSGPKGMASVWDYDLVLMGISHITEAMNRYRAGRGEKPTRKFRPHVSEILKFCRRSDGGRQYEEIEAALDRLSTTTIKVVRNVKSSSGRMMREAETPEGLIRKGKVISYADDGKVALVEIELAEWVYNEVVESKRPHVLTVDPDFFLIEPGIGRFVYRLARRAAGRSQAKWTFRLLYERSGSAGTFKEFCRLLRKGILTANDLPEYDLAEERGKEGPMLVMTHRNAKPADLSVGCVIDGYPLSSDDAGR